MNKTLMLLRQGNVLSLQGKVNFRTVTGLHERIRHELIAGINEIDCSAVQEADSAAISLLLASLRLAKKRKIKLQISGMNKQLLSLAELYDVKQLLQPG